MTILLALVTSKHTFTWFAHDCLTCAAPASSFDVATGAAYCQEKGVKYTDRRTLYTINE